MKCSNHRADETGTPVFLGGAANQLYRMIAGRSDADADCDFPVVSVCYQEAARVSIEAGS